MASNKMSHSPSSSISSNSSDDYHFSSLSNLERQTLLDKDDEAFFRDIPQTPVLPPTRSTAFLDGVRGIAALLVYLHHFAPLYLFDKQHRGFGQKDPLTGETWTYIISLPFVRLFYSGGDAAVALFFVLSGFVLTISPLTKIVHMVRDNGGRTPHFWSTTSKSLLSATIRRPIRLYLPAFFAALTYAALRHTPVGPLAAFPDLEANVSDEIAAAARAFVKFFNPFQQHGINQEWFTYGIVVWTIPIELKGSMLVFLLTGLYAFASQSRFYRRLYFLQLIGLSTLLLFLNQWTMSLFVAGMVLALCDIYGLSLTSLPLLSRSPHLRRCAGIINHLTLFVGIYLLSQPSHKSSINYSLHTPGWGYLTTLIPRTYLTESGSVEWFDPEYFRFWTSIGGVLTLYALLRISWAQRLFASRVPMYLGKISFALYLTHVTVLIISIQFLHRAVGQWYAGPPLGEKWFDNVLYLPEWGPIGLSVRYLGSLALQLPISIAVAHVVTILWDRPALKIAHMVANALGLSTAKGHAKKESMAKFDPLVLAGKDEWNEKIRERRLA